MIDLPLAAVQLRPGHSHYDKALGRWQETTWLECIVAEPGWHHSRYRRGPTERLYDPTPEEALARATRLAAPQGVPVYTAPSNAQTWIAIQPAGPAIEWLVGWTAARWCADGVHTEHAGTEQVTATSGDDATQEAIDRVAERLGGGGRGLVKLKTALPLNDRVHQRWHTTPMDWPAGAPPEDWFRRRARGGERPSEMLRGLPDLTPLQAMWIVSASFKLSLDAVAPVGAWRRQALPATQMDAMLQGQIQANELRWGLGWLLRGVWYREEPMRQAMLSYKERGVGPIEMIQALRAGFGLPLRYGKELIDLCCSSSTTDSTFEARFGACAREHAGDR